MIFIVCKLSIVFMLSAVCASAGFADEYDFLPRQGICGVGRIAACRHLGENDWEIELEHVEVLLECRERDKEKIAWPEEMAVQVTTGEVGSLKVPSPKWVGKNALFAAKPVGAHVVAQPSNKRLPLSPDGSTFFVFDAEPEKRVEKIRAFVKIMKVKDVAKRLQGFYGVVESEDQPLFLQSFAARQIGRISIEKQDLADEIRKRLANWRDSEKMPIALCLAVDDVLVDVSPASYQLSKERIDFLTAVVNSPISPPEQADHARRRLEQAQQKRETNQ
jgi:hypothetical protein